MSIIRKIFGLGPKVDCHELIRNGAVLIDVRTPSEYSAGHAKGSTNIPLDKIKTKVDKIKQLKNIKNNYLMTNAKPDRVGVCKPVAHLIAYHPVSL